MDFNGAQELLLDKANQARLSKGLLEFLPSEDLGAREDTTAKNHFSIELVVADDQDESTSEEWLLGTFQTKFEAEDPELDTLYSKVGTHLGVRIRKEENLITIQFIVLFYYLDIEPIGPVIDGDIVLQGNIVDDGFLPCLCTLEVELVAGSGTYEEVTAIPPTRMMINTGDDTGEELDSSARKFMIPVSLAEEHREMAFIARIYVQEKVLVNLDEEMPDFAALERRKDMVLAVVAASANVEGSLTLAPVDGEGEDIMQSAQEIEGEGDEAFATSAEVLEVEEEEARALRTGGQMLEDDDIQANDGVSNGKPSLRMLVDVHVATDYDDVVALQHEGYELLCTHVTPDGPQSEQDQLWKFHVLGEYSEDLSRPGLEDLVFVKTLKSLGTLPAMPFYNILHDYDLSNAEDDYAVYIATKVGPNPKFSQLTMLSCAMEDEAMLKKYVADSRGGIYRAGPEEIDRIFHGHCGLFLLPLRSSHHGQNEESGAVSAAAAIDTAAAASTCKPAPFSRQSTNNIIPAQPQDSTSMTGASMQSEEDEEPIDDEEEMIASLLQRIGDLESERSDLTTLNAELQKKAVTLMVREKVLQGQQSQGQTQAANKDANAPPTEANPTATNADQLTYEQTLEKEKQYSDTLKLIVEAREKLDRQVKDFDQLALDLQTRLDDKEFNAKSISASYREFKKEILLKAENSRTGHHISKIQIEGIEGAESKREEELEKVRLRNIGLRNLQRKLDNLLRAREQLAEGLHMIDFEQLKIENQTLNEKIEERNEDLAKLKRKKTTTVQILTHIREKLRFTENSNRVLRDKLNSLETIITKLRNTVTSFKLERDAIRIENKELKAKQGFATSDLLLMDFENQKHHTDVLNAEVTELKNRYEILFRQVQFGSASQTAGSITDGRMSSKKDAKLLLTKTNIF